MEGGKNNSFAFIWGVKNAQHLGTAQEKEILKKGEKLT